MKSNNTKIYHMSFASIYPHYITKVEKKWKSKQEVDQIIYWLTWYNEAELKDILEDKTDMETFFTKAPYIHPNVDKITWLICGYRIEDIQDPIMKHIRYLDKLIDELAKWRPMDKILRK